MIKQRGNLYVVLALVIAAGGALTALVLAWNHYTATLEKVGYDRGVAETTAAYAKRDNAQLQAVISERDRLLNEKEAIEARHATELKAQEAQSAQKLAQKDADYDSFIGDINAGRIVWRRPGETGSGAAGGDQGAAGKTAGDTGAGAGQVGRGAVPSETEDALFLASEAKRADRVLEKLSLCRATLEVERRP